MAIFIVLILDSNSKDHDVMEKFSSIIKSFCLNSIFVFIYTLSTIQFSLKNNRLILLWIRLAILFFKVDLPEKLVFFLSF